MINTNLFDYLNIQLGDSIIEHPIGRLQIINKDQFNHIGINLISDIMDLKDENSLTIIVSVGFKEKIRNVINKCRLIKNLLSCKNIYIIYYYDNEQNDILLTTKKLFWVIRCFTLSALLYKNPLLFYRYKQKQVVLNLIPDWLMTIEGKGFINSLISFFYKSTQNIISLSKIDYIIIEFSA
jgi:hypothetical protein